jgi:hypothetical protein
VNLEALLASDPNYEFVLYLKLQYLGIYIKSLPSGGLPDPNRFTIGLRERINHGQGTTFPIHLPELRGILAALVGQV